MANFWLNLAILVVGGLGGYALRTFQLNDALTLVDSLRREVDRLRNDIGKLQGRRETDKGNAPGLYRIPDRRKQLDGTISEVA